MSGTTELTRIDPILYYMKIALVVSERSTCRRHKIGAIAVKDGHIIATGYNGAPSHVKDCLELGCTKDEVNAPTAAMHELCRGVHAEQNVIIQAGLHGMSLEESIIFCTHTPCILCAKMLVNAKISRFISLTEYDDPRSAKLFNEVGIVNTVLKDVITKTPELE